MHFCKSQKKGKIPIIITVDLCLEFIPCALRFFQKKNSIPCKYFYNTLSGRKSKLYKNKKYTIYI